MVVKIFIKWSECKKKIIFWPEKRANKKKFSQSYKPDKCEHKLEKDKLRNQVEELARKLQEKEAEMESLKSPVQYLLKKEKLQESKKIEMKKGQFNNMNLRDKQNKWFY